MKRRVRQQIGGLVMSRSGVGFIHVVLLAVAGALAVGCARVPPYQRGRLAHPTMLLKDMAGAAESHVYAIHEGAVGGGTGAEGGCGCN
jgi:hypothetical protein